MTTKLTFMQKLLGKNYKWWYVFMQGFRSNTAYRLNSIAFLLASVILVSGTLIVWFLNKDSDFREIFTYIVIGEAFIFPSAIQYHIGEAIQDGKFSSRLMMPSSYLKYYAFYSFGQQFFENTSRFFVYLLLTIIFSQFVIFSPTFPIFILAVVIAYFINTMIGVIVGSSSFFFTAFYGTASFFESITFVFGGKFFPFDKLSFLKPLIFTSFAFTFYHPMQIYLGKYDFNQTVLVFVGGIAWSIILYFLAKWICKIGLKRNEAVGL